MKSGNLLWKYFITYNQIIVIEEQLYVHLIWIFGFLYLILPRPEFTVYTTLKKTVEQWVSPGEQ